MLFFTNRRRPQPFAALVAAAPMLLLMSLTALASAARADVKGIPFEAAFESAAFPYARTVTHCTDWRKPDHLGETWGAVSFASACVLHDRCFHRPGSSWEQCNTQYVQDLRESCRRDLEGARLQAGKAGSPDPQALALCYQISDLFAKRGRDQEVKEHFAVAQRHEADYLSYVRQVVNTTYQSVLSRAATGKELDRALATLTEDYSLDDLKAALMGERLELEAAAPALDLEAPPSAQLVGAVEAND